MDERRDDWRHGVDENLASLNSGQRVWEHDQQLLGKALSDIDALLRGSTEEDTDGMVARVHNLENDVALMKAILLTDKAGNKGIVSRVEDLESGERTSDNRWKFATAVVVAILSLAGLVATNWQRIDTFMTGSDFPSVPRPVPHRRHRRVVIHEIPAETDPE